MADTRDTSTDTRPQSSDAQALHPASGLVSVVACAAAGLFLILALTALRQGFADLQYVGADLDVGRWRESGAMPSLEDWLKTRDQLAVANRYAGGSPTMEETLGVWHAQRLATGSGSQVFQDQALQHFKAALIARPTSAYTWANIVSSKYNLGQVDQEMFLAMERAETLGKWEPWVQWVLVDVGLSIWDESPGSIRTVVTRTLERGMLRQKQEMVKLIRKRGRLSEACAALPSLGEQYGCVSR